MGALTERAARGALVALSSLGAAVLATVAVDIAASIATQRRRLATVALIADGMADAPRWPNTPGGFDVVRDAERITRGTLAGAPTDRPTEQEQR